jgi:hypothetical protein
MNTAKLAAATVLALSLSTGLAAAATMQRDSDAHARAATNSIYQTPAWQFRCSEARANPFENPGMVQQFCGPQAR